MRGWIAALRRQREPTDQVKAYTRLKQLFRFFATWNVLDWSDAAAAEFASQRKAKVRIGAMDLKIASICLVEDTTLLSRNKVDFERVASLRVEDWLS